MVDDWWKYTSGFVAALFGAFVKDAVRDGQIRLRVAALEEHAKKVCVCDGQCAERRKDCNASLRREIDLGADRLGRIEDSIVKMHERLDQMLKIMVERK